MILLRETDEPPTAAHLPSDLVFAHERVHLLQYDQAVQSWSTPLEEWLLPKLPGGGWLVRHVDLGLVMLPAMLLSQGVPYESRPWEREADFFAGSNTHRLGTQRP